MCERFEAEGTAITRVYHCPYHPQDRIGEYRRDHPWRKPKPSGSIPLGARFWGIK
jgi:D-glycero-D-manno-heptose 1,7-bisphosphate phosphatase